MSIATEANWDTALIATRLSRAEGAQIKQLAKQQQLTTSKYVAQILRSHLCPRRAPTTPADSPPTHHDTGSAMLTPLARSTPTPPPDFDQWPRHRKRQWQREHARKTSITKE